jgi:hypothetical protein
MAAVIALMTAFTPAQTHAQDPAQPVRVAPPGVTVAYPLADVDPVQSMKDVNVRDASPEAQAMREQWLREEHGPKFEAELRERAKRRTAVVAQAIDNPIALPVAKPDLLATPIAAPALGKIGGNLYRPNNVPVYKTIRARVVLYQTPTQTVGIPEWPSLLSVLVQDLNAQATHGGVHDVEYQVVAQTTIVSLPPRVPAGLPFAGEVDVNAVYNAVGACTAMNNGDYEQLWFISDGPSVNSPIEWSVNGWTWNGNLGANNQPKCGEAGAFFAFVYSTRNSKTGAWSAASRYNALHSYSHFLEGMVELRAQSDMTLCDYTDGGGRAFSSTYTNTANLDTCNTLGRPPSWQYGFTSHATITNSNVAVCGDVHYPPNITTIMHGPSEYIYNAMTVTQSICNSWNWGAANPSVGVNCTTWSTDCSNGDLSEALYLIWWGQHLPYSQSTLIARGGGARPPVWRSMPYLPPKPEAIPRGDINSDGKADYVLYRPSDGYFYTMFSNGSGYTMSPSPCILSPFQAFTAWSGWNTPAAQYLVAQSTTGKMYQPVVGQCANTSPGSYSGTHFGAAKMAPYNVHNSSDIWQYNQTSGVWGIFYKSGVGPFPASFTLGGPGYVPAMADYDGDGITDPAVFNKTTGDWKMRKSTGGGAITTATWGAGYQYTAAPNDIDGDGVAEIMVFNTYDGFWHVKVLSTSGATLSQSFGASGDIPVMADYDGDGWKDWAVFRPSTGYWYYMSHRGIVTMTNWGGGVSGDVPLSGLTW